MPLPSDDIQKASPLETPARLDEVRASFTEGLARVCLSLSLGHFLCVIPLYLLFGGHQARAVLVALTSSGAGLLLLAFLCRYRRIRGILAYFSLGLLFVQTAYFLSEQHTLIHPLTMLFPLLCALAPPILGPGGAYRLAAISSVLFLAIHASLPDSPSGLPGLALLLLVQGFSAHLSEVLWESVLRRERELHHALSALKRQTTDMEQWIGKLGRAGELISAGHLSTSIPEPPPSEVFEALTRSMSHLQAKLNQHFTDLFLQDRLNSLGVLASGVAHELNTPLTTMQFLLQGADDIPAETRELLLMEVQRLSKIARALLSFARPGEAETLDLGDLVTRTEPLLKRVPCTNLKLAITSEGERLLVRGVASEIQQILINLFQNAVDALEGVESPSIHLQTRAAGSSEVELLFEDNGCGMKPETLSRILDPFFTTKPPGKGTGLGLFITHQIVQRHGARLEIKSQPGRGTAVRLLFRREEAHRGSRKEAA